MTNYMTKRDAVLNDPAASFWLKTAVSALERRDPVDAFNDAEALRQIAFCRMETAFEKTVTAINPKTALANGYYCEECGNTVICNPDSEDMRAKTRLCTGCWLRENERLLNRRMGRVAS